MDFIHVEATPIAALNTTLGMPYHSLPVGEVIREGYTSLTLRQVLKAMKTGRLIFTTNEDGYWSIPVWQFCAHAPTVLLSALPSLFAVHGAWTSIFMMTAYKELVGLTPAEALAGFIFADRSYCLETAALNILEKSATDRVYAVLDLNYRSKSIKGGW